MHDLYSTRTSIIIQQPLMEDGLPVRPVQGATQEGNEMMNAGGVVKGKGMLGEKGAEKGGKGLFGGKGAAKGGKGMFGGKGMVQGGKGMQKGKVATEFTGSGGKAMGVTKGLNRSTLGANHGGRWVPGSAGAHSNSTHGNSTQAVTASGHHFGTMSTATWNRARYPSADKCHKCCAIHSSNCTLGGRWVEQGLILEEKPPAGGSTELVGGVFWSGVVSLCHTWWTRSHHAV